MIDGIPFQEKKGWNRRWVLVVMLVVVQALSAQTDPDSSFIFWENMFEAVSAQVEYSVTVTPDSLVRSLLREAQRLAREGDWPAALEMVTLIQELIRDGSAAAAESENPSSPAVDEPVPTDPPEVRLPDTAAPLRFQWEVGVDYSRQEFEMTYWNTDSLVVDELRNPYLAVQYTQRFGNEARGFDLFHRLRWDRQFIVYNVFNQFQIQRGEYISRVYLDGGMYRSATDSLGHFLDGQLGWVWGKWYRWPTRWYVGGRSRIKRYLQKDSLRADLTYGYLQMVVEHYFSLNASLALEYFPEIYRESRGVGQFYRQHRLQGRYDWRRSYRQWINAVLGWVYRRFENQLNQEQYRNTYRQAAVQFRMDWPLLGPINGFWELSAAWRKHGLSDEVNPDFREMAIKGLVKYYPQLTRSLGAGMVWGYRRHSAGRSLPRSIREQDYSMIGGVVQVNYLNQRDWFFTLEYQLLYVIYPESRTTSLPTFYSNRVNHSITALGWIPLFSRWQLQVSINYDRQRHPQYENSDSRNSVFNVGLVYAF